MAIWKIEFQNINEVDLNSIPQRLGSYIDKIRLFHNAKLS